MSPAWLRELLLGARMALAGGRSGLARAALTAVGVGLGVALLLAAVSIPNMMQARTDRGAARADMNFGMRVELTDRSTLIGYTDMQYGGQSIRGRLLQAEGSSPVVPPGLSALPRPGEMAVSPALARLLLSPEGALLRERLHYPTTTLIADEGLQGPGELAFYLGTDELTADTAGVGRRNGFGEESTSEGLDPVLLLLVVIIFVVLLLPVAMFVASAIRFGGDSRDRRLAGVRLVGADTGMARRIAAGEAMLSALLGVATGAVMFLAGRTFVGSVDLLDISVYPSDVQPDPVLAALIVVAVPAAAVVVTVLSLRRVMIEPLGVVRRGADARRRLWWRLLMPVVGVLLLLPLVGSVSKEGERFSEWQVIGGVCFILLGVATLLPWLVQSVVRRIQGGPVAWQLAMRRLQLDGSTSARAVTGVAVAVAGAIGLQMMFAVVEANYQRDSGQNPALAQISVYSRLPHGWSDVAGFAARLAATPGVTSVTPRSILSLNLPVLPDGEEPSSPLTVGDCAVLRQLAELGECADGDTFLVDNPDLKVPAPGTAVTFGEDGTRTRWTVPAGARTVRPLTDPLYGATVGVLTTPAALPAAIRDQPGLQWQALLTVDPAAPDMADRVTNTRWEFDPLGSNWELNPKIVDNKFAQIRRGLFAGAAVTLLLIGASLLVVVLEQLRDRRRLLAVLVAFGTRRRTMSWAILWQTAVPVLLGLVLACAAGLGLGAVLLRIIDQPVAIDWTGIAVVSGIAGAVILLVTALSLPVLWRLMRAEGLRTE
ncbi:FtsX-like permease family protein [Catellatospora paridis]|uniref:FtsX-like permease family protein n=1 Tax=Catellatospora paridis TaxID=1617086 RepID=UPI001E3BC3F4|nr:ABC transporter permease [Catellatospora paridis]